MSRSLPYKLESSMLGILWSIFLHSIKHNEYLVFKIMGKWKKEWLNGWLTDSEGMNLTGCPEVIKAYKLYQGGWGEHTLPKGVKKHGTRDLLPYSIMNTTAMLEVSKDPEADAFRICCHKLP